MSITLGKPQNILIPSRKIKIDPIKVAQNEMLSFLFINNMDFNIFIYLITKIGF
jgi:hypothetical protein